MAKKVVATLKTGTGKQFTKCIKMVKSDKTGAYIFKEGIIANDQVKDFSPRRNKCNALGETNVFGSQGRKESSAGRIRKTIKEIRFRLIQRASSTDALCIFTAPQPGRTAPIIEEPFVPSFLFQLLHRDKMGINSLCTR